MHSVMHLYTHKNIICSYITILFDIKILSMKDNMNDMSLQLSLCIVIYNYCGSATYIPDVSVLNGDCLKHIKYHLMK